MKNRVAIPNCLSERACCSAASKAAALSGCNVTLPRHAYGKDYRTDMSKLEKLLQRIKNNPKSVRFEELDKILVNAEYECNQPRRGSSHYTYRKLGREPITIPRRKPFVHEVYVQKVIRELNL